MKKIFPIICFVLILSMLVAPMISSLDIDNVKQYDPVSRTAYIKNSFLGISWLSYGEVAEIKLITSPHHNIFGSGDDAHAMEIEVTNHEPSRSYFINDMQFYDYFKFPQPKEGHFTYKKYDEEISYEVPIFEDINCINATGKCDRVQTGTEIKYGAWEDWEISNPIPIGTHRIRAYWSEPLLEDERVEWIPTMYGVEIPEWADFGTAIKSEFQDASQIQFQSTGGLILQGFTMGVAGPNSSLTLKGVQINADSPSSNPEDCTYEIWSVNSSFYPQTMLTQNVSSSCAEIELGGGYFNRSFGNEITLSKGQSYALIAGTRTGVGDYRWWSNPNESAYDGGPSSKKTAPGNWSDFIFNQTLDMFFQIWGDTFNNPVVTLNTPANNSNAVNPITFNCSAHEQDTSNGIVNLSLVSDGLTIASVVNVSANQVNISLESTQALSLGTHNWTCFAIDTLNNKEWASSNRTITANTFIENSQTWNGSTVEEATESFEININYSSSAFSVITGVLNYNNTNYTGTKTGSGDNAIFTRSLQVPSIVTGTNKSFYWQIGLTNTSGTTWTQSGTKGQLINPINASVCGAPLSTAFLNFTIYDEATLVEINGTFKATFTYRAATATTSKTLSYQDLTGNNSKYQFCFDPADKDFIVSSNLEYSAPGYTTKFFNFQDVTVTNATNVYSLYLLNNTDSTSFIIRVRDAEYIDVSEAEVHVQRFDIGTGLWQTTQIVLTNFDGKAIAQLFTEDADYRFLVYVGGDLKLTSGSTKIACEVTPCTVTLTLPADSLSEFEPYETLDGLTTSLTYNDVTNFFTYSAQDSSSDFVESRLEVYHWTPGNGTSQTPSCNVTSSDAISILTCDISPTTFQNGTYVATGYNSRTGALRNPTDRIVVKKITSITNTIGEDGVLWSMFILITIVMLGVYRPALAIIFGALGFFMLYVLQLLAIGWISVTAVIAIAIILLMEVKRQ